MAVRPLELGSLPRATLGPAYAVQTAPQRTALLGRRIELRYSPFGAGALVFTAFGNTEDPLESDAVWALARAGEQRRALLVLDGMTALRIVAATLGIPPPRVLRSLGTTERGVVTAAIAGVIRALGGGFTVELGRTPPGGHRTDHSSLIRVFVQARFATGEERFRIDVPHHWLPEAACASWLPAMSRLGLEIPMTVLLARTRLTAADWSCARPGDAVVFEDHPTPANGPRRAWLVCGVFAAEIELADRGDGVARMIGDFQPGWTPPPLPAPAATEREGKAMKSQSTDLPVTMLASAPIEVVAELARLVMRADEVVALRPGTIVPVGALRSDLVTLMVGDRPWARGELVDVDGQLGVRLTSVTATAEQGPVAMDADEGDTLR